MNAISARAAILRAPHEPMSIETVEVADPRPDEVRVRLVATGICHTDLLMMEGVMPAPMPLVLGHEGAGIIEAVGCNVTTHQVGDPVVLSFAHCDHCHQCEKGAPTYCTEFLPRNFGCMRSDGSSAFAGESAPHSHFFGQSSFASYAICNARSAIRVSRKAPLELLGPLGCSVQTGAGAVINALKAEPGCSIAIFGTGAVGLSAIMAARIIGAHNIIAVDLHAQRLALASELGATDVIEVAGVDLVAQLHELVPGGIDYAVDTTGVPAVVDAAIAALAVRGKAGLIAGVPGKDAVLPIGHLLAGGREVRGICEGDAQPENFIPQLVEWHLEGRLPIEKMVQFFALDQINHAVAALANGTVVKPIIRF